jgi:tight adherence protein B
MSVTQAIPLLVFVAVLLSVTTAYLLLSARRSQRHSVSRRLGELGFGQSSNQGELTRVRRARSLSPEGHYSLPFIPLNQLILQSGVTVGVQGVLFAMAFLTAGTYFVLSIVQGSPAVAMIGALALGVGLPVVVMRSMRTSRQRKFEEQLPEAIDILVRGLKAGHAIPFAIGTVGRQMAQPVGSEFSITGSELTYGLDLETAMVNMRTRVGQADLSLLVVAVSIQAKMGGNLAEILTNLARIIRERFKLRRKARALSSEGRYSALFLSLLPVALFGILWLIAPSYYGLVWGEWFIVPTLGAAVLWMIFGNYIMYRMVKFSV